MLFKATAQKTVVFPLLLLNTLLLIQAAQHKGLAFLHLWLSFVCFFPFFSDMNFR